MTITNQLGAMVTRPVPVEKGEVTSISTNSIYVSSRRGLKEFQVANPSSFRLGDTVKFQGNSYLGKLPSSQSNKIFVV
jgi:hypothetical protein